MLKRKMYTKENAKLYDDEQVSLGYRSLLSPRYPLSISTRDKAHTELKRRYIYREYISLVDRIREFFPDMAKFLPKKYYYMVVAERLGLSEGYVSVSVTQYQKRYRAKTVYVESYMEDLKIDELDDDKLV